MENQNKIQKFKKENNDLILNKFQSQLERILKGQEITWDEMRRGFIGLAQQKQEKLYESALRKEREAKRIKRKSDSLYTKEELDAINYFKGTGFYAKHQDLKTKPNIFDTRQTFLLKMHDSKLR